MTDRTVAKRYAKALYDIGTEQNKSEIFAADMEELAAILKDNGEVRDMLLNQSIQNDEKKKAVNLILADSDPVIRNFVALVIDKHRADSLEAMCDSYREYREEQANVLRAHVSSAVPLSEEQLRKIEEKFSKMMGSSVTAEAEVDEALIGGVCVRIGDTVYDGSIAHHLKQMNDSLKQTVL